MWLRKDVIDKDLLFRKGTLIAFTKNKDSLHLGRFYY